MVDINEAVVRDSTMWWVEWSWLEFFSTLGLPTIQVLDRQDKTCYLATSVSGMYFDESDYFLDCSTGFISRSKKAAKKEDLVSILFSLSEANICWPIISEMRVNTKQVVTQTGFRTLPRSRRGVFRFRRQWRTEEVSKGHDTGDGTATFTLTLMFVGGDFLYSLERESVKRLLLGSAHLLQESCNVINLI